MFCNSILFTKIAIRFKLTLFLPTLTYWNLNQEIDNLLESAQFSRFKTTVTNTHKFHRKVKSFHNVLYGKFSLYSFQ